MQDETVISTASALHEAARSGDADQVISLLAAGADCNSRHGEDDETPLQAAASAGQLATTEALLEAGASVDAVDPWGRTALMWAVGYGARPAEPELGLPVVRLLLEHGADASHAANGLELDTPLLAAAKAGSEEAVRLLLEAGADVNTKNRYQETALTLAAAEGHTQVVSVLLDWGAEVNLVNEFGDTPLLDAAWGEHEDTLRLLLAKGADPNVPNGIGHTAITTTLWFPRNRILAILLEGGANPNLRDTEGLTSLMLGLYDEEAVRLLLKHGADFTLRDDRGRTALQQAIEDCDHNAIPLLKAAGAEE